MSDRPVYSTDKSKAGGDKPGQKNSGKPLAGGPLKMRLETKGRGGKAVTVLFNLPLSEADAKAMMRELQEKLGCGATFKDGTIEMRGDMRDRLEPLLVARGLKVVRAGG
jgi:translation initiation factor 1